MSLSILHLSDMHIVDDSLVSKIPQMVGALRQVDPDAADVVVAVTGDIAQEGKQEQYLFARGFLSSLKKSIEEGLGAQCVVAVVPGNHDCDLSGNQVVRDALITSVWDKGLTPEECPIAEQVGSVQESFFCELSDWVDLSSITRDCAGGRLAWLRTVSTGEIDALALCINTAWMSTESEQQGHLRYPVEIIPSLPATGIVLALMHHPYSWLQEADQKKMRRFVESNCDLLMTGHEHEGYTTTLALPTGKALTHVEGGVFSSVEGAVASINVVAIQSEDRRYKVFSFSLEFDRFELRLEGPWTEFLGNQNAAKFPLKPEIQQYLDDTGVPFSHPRRQLKLSDVFVPPRLRRFTPGKSPRGQTDIVQSDEVIHALFANERVFLSGVSLSGKTSLAKTLFVEALGMGLVPIAVSALAISGVDGVAIRKAAEKAFVATYESVPLSAFQQMAPTEKVLIVDDFNRAGLNRSGQSQLFQSMAAGFRYVFIFGDGLTQAEDFILTAEAADRDTSDYVGYDILPFGYYERDQVIEKWVTLGREHRLTDEQKAANISKIAHAIDQVIQVNRVPPLPLYVLTLLQQVEAGQSLDLGSGAQGYFFEALLRASLERTSVSIDSIELKFTLLAEFAGTLYDLGDDSLESDKFSSFVTGHWDKYRLTGSSGVTVNELESANLIIIRESSVEFRYKYLQYYFLARHLRDGLGQSGIEAIIDEMVRTIHREESANVLIMLTYLTRNELLIRKVLEEAKTVLADVPACDLADHVAWVARLQGMVPAFVLPEASPSQHRKSMLRARDDVAGADSGKGGRPESEEELAGDIADINRAFKILQVMGEISKAFSETLPGSVKLALVEESFAVALRALSWFYLRIEENLDGIVEELADYLKERKTGVTNEQMIDATKNFVFQLTWLLAYGCIERISMAVGSERLIRVYLDVEERHDDIASLFVQLALRLDHDAHFPKKRVFALQERIGSDPLVTALLGYMITRHFSLFPRSPALVQSVCAKMGIAVGGRLLAGSAGRV